MSSAPRLRRLLKLTAAAVLVLATGGPSVVAQFDDSNPAIYWRRERERAQQRARPPVVVQRPTHLIRRAAPRRGYAREVPASQELEIHQGPELADAPAPPAAGPEGGKPTTTADAPVAAPPAAAGPATAPPSPTPDSVAGAPQPAAPERVAAPAPSASRMTIAVLGDNVAQILAQGLQEAFADSPDVSILEKARENTGLVRADYHDWPKAVRELLAGPERVSLGVMMVGSNDRQALRDASGAHEPSSPRWKELYAQRIAAVATAFRERKIPLIWVGMPIMRNERLSHDLIEMNEMFRDAAGAAGAIYVDVWEAFVDDRNQFAPYGPDLNGQIVRLRTGDGVHFTKAGARKLAHFVEGDVKRLLDARKPAPGVAAAPVAPVAPVAGADDSDVRIPLPGIGGAVPPGQLAIPLPAPAPAIVIPTRPAAGPVLALTAPALSPNGELVTRAAANAADERAAAERLLTNGRPADTRTGRADDFRWPRD